MSRIFFPKHRRLDIHLAVVLGICAAFFVITAFIQSLRSPVPAHGNYWTDMSILVQANNFKECGFLPHKLVATWDQGCRIGLPLPRNTSFTSIHSSFAAIVVALLQQIGLTLPVIRLVMLFLSTTAILGVYLFTNAWFKSEKLALNVSFCFATLPFFRLLSDNLTVPYDIGVRIWMYYFVSRYALSSTTREGRKWLMLCFGSGLLNGLFFSVEIVPSIVMFSVLAPLAVSIIRGNFSLKKFAILPISIGVAYLISGGLRLAHLYWVLGSVDSVAQMVIGRASRRLASPGILTDTPVLGYLSWLIYRIIRLAPLHAFFALAGVVLGGLAGKKMPGVGLMPGNRVGFLYWQTIPILGSEVFWYFLFQQHSYEHDHTILQIALSLALFSGLSLYWVSKVLEQNHRFKFAFGVFVALLAYGGISLIGVRSLGYNVQKFFDTSFLDKQIQVLSPLFEDIEIVNFAEPPSFPPFYLAQRFEQLPNKPILTWRSVDELEGRRYLLLANPYSPIFEELLNQYGLVGLTRHYAFFDPQMSPSFLNSVYANSNLKMEESWMGNVGVVGFWLGAQPISVCVDQKSGFNGNGKLSWLLVVPPDLQREIAQSNARLELEIRSCKDHKSQTRNLLLSNEIWDKGGVYKLETFGDSNDLGGIISLRCTGISDCVDASVFVAPIMITPEGRRK